MVREDIEYGEDMERRATRVCRACWWTGVIFTAQCTLVQMRGIRIECRPSVRLSVCDVGDL